MAPGLHVVEAGTGPTLVLVHGAMDRLAGLARAARHLGAFRVVRYDRRGYAGSAPLGPGDLATHAADLVDLLGALRVGGRPGDLPGVVGHSLGGLVALAAARLAPGLIGAVGAHEPPTPWHRDWPPGIEDWAGDDTDAADLVIGRAVGVERWARAPAALRAARRAEGGAMMTEVRSLFVAPPGSLPAPLGPVATPVILAHGSAGRAHVRTGVADLAGRLGTGAPERLEGPGHRAPTTHAPTYARWTASVARLSVPAAAGDGA